MQVLALLLCLAASVSALSTHHAHRALAAHHAIARRSPPSTHSIRRRADGKRCKVRSSSIAAATHNNAVISTSTKAEPTTTKAEPTTTKAQPTTTKAQPTTTKAQPTTTQKPATTKAEPTTTKVQPTTTQKPATTKAEPTTTQKPATTKATTTKAPATTTASSNAPSFMVGTQTGEGTFYTTGLGACGIVNNDDDYIAAVSHLLFDNYPGYDGSNPNKNPMCGRKVLVTYGGASVTVALTDRCEGCAVTDLDFSPAAFKKLAEFSVGRIPDIKWVWL